METGKKSLAKNAVLNAIKQGCGIVFPFISFSYCSHVLGAEKIGMVTLSQSIVSYCAYLATFGINEYAIREASAIRDSKKRIEKFANQVFSVNIIMTVLSYILLFVVLFAWDGDGDYSWLLIIQSGSILLTTIGADWINTVYEDYQYIAVRYIIVQTIGILLMLAFIKKPDDLFLYTFFTVFASAGGNLFNVFYIRKYIQLRFVFKMDFVKHFKSMSVFFLNNLSLMIYLNSDIIILRCFLDDISVGVYSIATKIYMIIKSLINAVTVVAIPRLSYLISQGDKENISEICSEIMNTLFFILIPTAIGLFFKAEDIIRIVAGSEYLGGIPSLKVYCFGIIFAVIACFNSYVILIPFKKEKKFLLITVLAAALNICANFILIPWLGITGAAITTLFAEATVAILSYGVARKTVRLIINWSDLLKEFTGGFLIIILCIIFNRFIHVTSLRLAVSIIVSAGCYFVSQIVLKNSTVYRFTQMITKKVR